MDFVIDGIEALFNIFYLKTGKILFGAKFSENPKSFPLRKRVVAGGISLGFALGVAGGLWFGIALVFE